MSTFEQQSGSRMNVADAIEGMVSSYFNDNTPSKPESIRQSGPLVHGSWGDIASTVTTETMHFSTFQEASAWARQNPGKVITPAPQGNGYISR